MASNGSDMDITPDELFDYSEYYNLNGTSNSPPCDNKNIKNFGSVFLPILYTIVFVLGLVGNILVLALILSKCKKLKSMTDMYLLNLALSDLLFVLSLPFLAYYAADEWVFGSTMCHLVTLLYLFGYYSGIFFITLMSIDRYLAVVHAIFALRARSITYGIITSLVVWCVAFLATLPQLLLSEVQADSANKTCRPNYSSQGWKLFLNLEVIVLGFICPMIIMGYCYTYILIVLIKSRNANKKKAIKLVFIVMITFQVFWAPYNCVILLDTLLQQKVLDGCETSQGIMYTTQVTEAIAFFHCCLNPLIYAFLGEKFQKYLCEVLQKILSLAPLCKSTGISRRYLSVRRSSVRTQSTGSSDLDIVL
ncbi:C-C chemokine receptor type 4-like [Protopterus annectens]|uniref:C-C chemokine receptor type 4-like n=1 Tax=Protopterus annectens TaxID=7888 RepID=UPI001CFABF06|nr:C-C chemokine receptor type 4-like [Protopterus annectens]